jgi:hypothetical protein
VSPIPIVSSKEFGEGSNWERIGELRIGDRRTTMEGTGWYGEEFLDRI